MNAFMFFYRRPSTKDRIKNKAMSTDMILVITLSYPTSFCDENRFEPEFVNPFKIFCPLFDCRMQRTINRIEATKIMICKIVLIIL